jgi:hypothetical protein
VTGLKHRIGSILAGIAAIGVFVASVFPVYWMVNTSFQPNGQVRGSELHFWPDNGTVENYVNVIFNSARAPFLPALGNSVMVTLLTVVVSLVFAFFAALAVTRFRFRSRALFIITILIIQMIPAEAMIISIFRLMDGWHLLNTVLGLSAVYIATVLPFTIWTLRGFVNGVPVELEEAHHLPAAGAGPGRHRHLRVHPGMERVPLRPRAQPAPRGDDAAGVAAHLPRPQWGHQLGRAHGRLHARGDPGRDLLPDRADPHDQRPRRGGGQGLMRAGNHAAFPEEVGR